jgi:D-alanine--D-alanine ligase
MIKPSISQDTMRTSHPTVGVLFGGRNIEHEVSFNSGRTVCNHIDTARFTIIPLYQSIQGALYILPERFLHRGKTTDFEHKLPSEAQQIVWDVLPSLVDIIFIAMHGRYGEDGALQGLLEILGIPYCGSKVFASALGMNKSLQKKILHHHGIATPQGIELSIRHIIAIMQSSQHLNENLLSSLSFPCVVKPDHEGSSLGVSIVENQHELAAAIIGAATIMPGIIQPVLIEHKIEGMEFSCIIVTHPITKQPWPLSLTEVSPEEHLRFYDYEQKYMPGRGKKYTPARCSTEQRKYIQDVCIKAMKALNMTNFARIDGFLTQSQEVIIMDPNSLGGMAPSSFTFLQAAEAGLSHTELINYLIDTELNYIAIDPTANKQEDSYFNKRTKIAVLMGGASAEREISLDSGRNVVYKLSPHTYDVIPLFVDEKLRLFPLSQKLLVKNTTAEITQELVNIQPIAWNQLADLVDFVFIALHGGAGENGHIQGALEFLGIPYNGSSIATSALCIDKYATAQFLAQEGFDVPRQLLIEYASWNHETIHNELSLKDFTFPVIIKPYNDGCSVLVQKAVNIAELLIAVNTIFATGRTHVLIESFLTGMELTIGVLGNEDPIVLSPSHSVKTKDILSIEEKFLPGAGENQTPAPLTQSSLIFVQDTIYKAYKSLGCQGYARIDCFYYQHEGQDKLTILEVNTLPGLTPATCIFHQAAELGMKPMELIDRIIQLGFAVHQKPIHIPHHSIEFDLHNSPKSL